MRRRIRRGRILGNEGLLGVAALLMGSTVAIAASGYANGFNFWNNGGNNLDWSG